MNIVRIKLLNEKAIFPTYADEGAAGFDFYSTSNLVIPVGGSGIVETGLAVEIPKGYEIQARGRSGSAFVNDIIAHFGTIDESYRGEIKIKLWNLGKKPFPIKAGQRIAQGVLAPMSVSYRTINLQFTPFALFEYFSLKIAQGIKGSQSNIF